MENEGGTAFPVPVSAVALCQLVCLRDMLRRGACFDSLYFNEITEEIVYERNGITFYMDRSGTIYKTEEVPVTHYETRRVFVSDRHEEKDLASRGVRIA